LGKTGEAIAIADKFAVTVAVSIPGVRDVLLSLVPELDQEGLSDRNREKEVEKPEG
jgi:hypothetical protein